MDAPIMHADGARVLHDHHEEGFLHYLAREGRVALQWTIVLSLIATAAMMVTPFWFLAFIPAGILLASYVLLTITNEVERRSDEEAHEVLERSETAVVGDIEHDAAEDGKLHPRDARLVKRESKAGIAILAGIMVIALLFAAFKLPAQVVAIGAFVVFAYMLLIAAPFWLGWFNEDIEHESQRLDHEDQEASEPERAVPMPS